MKTLRNKKWWAAAGTRAIKTMAQTAVATIGASTMITEINWAIVASATVVSGLLSMLTSIAGLPEVEEEV